jgi:ATP-dependent Clp protease ATP-binding subunit ClpC
MEGNFSNRVQDVIRLSREEALRLGHDYIGTEHLLLGVIREGEGIAVRYSGTSAWTSINSRRQSRIR